MQLAEYKEKKNNKCISVCCDPYKRIWPCCLCINSTDQYTQTGSVYVRNSIITSASWDGLSGCDWSSMVRLLPACPCGKGGGVNQGVILNYVKKRDFETSREQGLEVLLELKTQPKM